MLVDVDGGAEAVGDDDQGWPEVDRSEEAEQAVDDDPGEEPAAPGDGGMRIEDGARARRRSDG